jgi:DNA invertase Pin-like site-specific DNA recombinase
MSTEHQRYSLAAQAEAIDAYALANGFALDRSYFDPGESGLTFDKRLGLQALLSAALGEDRTFDAILVLDVSRWGRFQDLDQAAHYEYLCRSAGVRVIYCAEPFGDDDGPVSSLLKTLKRIMAAEFSRELSVKCQKARVQQAKLGFYQGGAVVYGVRRVVVDPQRRPRLELAPGQRKALAGDHVILQPGPPHELKIMRQIFRRYVDEERGPATIARELNAKGLPSVSGGPWRSSNVCSVLRNELAIGVYVSNKTDQTLAGPKGARAADQWVRVRVFDPIVQPGTFRRAQARMGSGRREPPSKPLMLQALAQLLRQHGRLNARLLNRAPGTYGAQTYRRAFGSLGQAYGLIGHVPIRARGVAPAAKRDQMINLLRQAHSRHGHVTARLINADSALPDVATYRKHFGSLTCVYELAGLPHRREQLLSAAHRRSIARGTASTVTGHAIGGRSPFSDDQLLACLRDTYARRGDMSFTVLDLEPGGPRPSLYKCRFGSLSRAYVLAGLPAEFLNRYRVQRFTRPLAEPGGAMAPPGA